jgi:fructose-1-phosphate kinase PfkB-like protein
LQGNWKFLTKNSSRKKCDHDNWKFKHGVDLLIPNETELELLSGTPLHTEADIVAASRGLIDRGVKAVIVTLGEKGCIYVNFEGFRVIRTGEFTP